MLQRVFQKSATGALQLDNIKAVFFDLDGTLVDVDMYRFVPGYLRRLTEQMRDLANPVKATRVMHSAVAAMFANEDADVTLEDIFLKFLAAELAVKPGEFALCLERFCRDDLGELQPLVTGHAMANDLVGGARARGWQVVLATNPIFPRAVVDARVSWGGLDAETFQYVSAYETSHFCKPNPAFFNEILEQLGYKAHECLMVGNDPLHDLAAGQTGMQTCLLTPWSISRPGVGFAPDWKGRHSELLELLKAE